MLTSKRKNSKRETKYKCQLCGRDIDNKAALLHIKAEEYIINLIKKDHPQWTKGSAACNACVVYYKKLIKEAEI